MATLNKSHIFTAYHQVVSQRSTPPLSADCIHSRLKQWAWTTTKRCDHSSRSKSRKYSSSPAINVMKCAQPRTNQNFRGVELSFNCHLVAQDCCTYNRHHHLCHHHCHHSTSTQWLRWCRSIHPSACYRHRCCRHEYKCMGEALTPDSGGYSGFGVITSPCY